MVALPVEELEGVGSYSVDGIIDLAEESAQVNGTPSFGNFLL
jgi:hypothetical protein